MMRFRCPGCSGTVAAPERLAGERVQCPKCGQAIVLPKLDQEAESNGGDAEDYYKLATTERPARTETAATLSPSASNSDEPTFAVPCPRCSRSLKAVDSAIGRKAKCPGCGHTLVLRPPSSNDGGSPPPLPDDRSVYVPAASNEASDKDAAQAWHLVRNGQIQSPVSPLELKRMANSGMLRPTDLLWREGLDDWIPANQVQNLFPRRSGPPPLPTATQGQPPTSPSPPEYSRNSSQRGMRNCGIVVIIIGCVFALINIIVSGFMVLCGICLIGFANLAENTGPAKGTRVAVQQIGPPLWNPGVAGVWSLFLSLGLGSFLVASNWRALGEVQRAKRAMLWFYAWLLLLSVNGVIPWTLISGVFQFVPHLLVGGANVALLLAWNFAECEPQRRLLKQELANGYERREWFMWFIPIVLACICLLAYMLFFLIVQSYYWAMLPHTPPADL